MQSEDYAHRISSHCIASHRVVSCRLTRTVLIFSPLLFTSLFTPSHSLLILISSFSCRRTRRAHNECTSVCASVRLMGACRQSGPPARPPDSWLPLVHRESSCSNDCPVEEDFLSASRYIARRKSNSKEEINIFAAAPKFSAPRLQLWDQNAPRRDARITKAGGNLITEESLYALQESRRDEQRDETGRRTNIRKRREQNARAAVQRRCTFERADASQKR